jgi:predicted HAD superfamily phosphohydrolase
MATEDIVVRDDIPVTSPVLTLLDLATELEPLPLERAVNDADKRGLVDPETLREELVNYVSQPGVRPLRHLLDKLFFQLSDSDLKIYFRRIKEVGPHSEWRLLVPIGPISRHSTPIQISGWSAGGDVRLRAAVGKQF